MARLPSLSGIEAFVAAARHASFTSAARELNVTQSAVSHRIRGLEQELGERLFIRGGRRLELTDAGRLLATAGTRALDELGAALSELRAMRDVQLMTVSCSPSFAIRWLVPRLPQFRERVAHADLRISADDRLADPGRDGFDACIRYGPGGYAEHDVRRLATDRAFPVCSPALARELVCPRDLSRHTLLHDEALAALPGRTTWRDWLLHVGASSVDPSRGLRFSHAYMALEAAVAGNGVALGRSSLVADDLASGRLVAPFRETLDSGLSYWLVTAAGKLDRPLTRVFADWLTDELNRAAEAR